MIWYEVVFRIALASIVGMAVGLQRERHGHPAGIKTHAMVCIGAAVISLIQLQMFAENPDIDPSRIIAQVVSGIGFIGAGCILRNDRNDTISGITTASTLWVVGCLGIAVGLGYYLICLASFTAVMIILSVVSLLRKKKRLPPSSEEKAE